MQRDNRQVVLCDDDVDKDLMKLFENATKQPFQTSSWNNKKLPKSFFEMPIHNRNDSTDSCASGIKCPTSSNVMELHVRQRSAPAMLLHDSNNLTLPPPIHQRQSSANILDDNSLFIKNQPDFEFTNSSSICLKMTTKAYSMFHAKGRPSQARDVSEQEIQKWRDAETEGKVLVCPRCLMSFTSHLGLLQHYRHCFDNVDIPPNSVKYSCPKCLSEFANTKSLSHHKRYCPGQVKMTTAVTTTSSNVKQVSPLKTQKFIEVSVVSDDQCKDGKTIYIVPENAADMKNKERVRVEMIKRKRPLEAEETESEEKVEEEQGEEEYEEEVLYEVETVDDSDALIQEEILEPVKKQAR